VEWNTVLNTKLSPRASVKDAAGEFYTQFPHDFFINEVFPVARPEPSFPPEIARAVWEMLQEAMFNAASGVDATNAAAEKIDAHLSAQ
jgi:multiple sugar transport system substrate-binding protein